MAIGGMRPFFQTKKNQLESHEKFLDWPSGHEGIEAYERLLWCPICHEFLSGAVSINICLHNC